MLPLAFINYRRTDSQQAALGLYLQLRARIGPGSVFMDRSGISAGHVWPKRLLEMMNDATLVLALLGPGWLTASDEYGRRRLDSTTDWVRNELGAAIKSKKPIVPLLLPPLRNMPSAEGLPRALRSICDRQAYPLREESWDADVNGLIGLLVSSYSFKEAEPNIRLPKPQVSIEPLTDAELYAELHRLPGWEPVESLIPGDYPNARRELRKVYGFESFDAAMLFMNSAVKTVKRFKHHPRWENQWRTVTVYLSTWDIGHRISRLDTDVAAAFDRVRARVG